MKPEDKVYRAYFESKKQSLYFNEIKELSKLSDSSLASTLAKFVKNGITVQEKTKSNTYYHIKDNKLFALKFSEIAMQKFNDLSTVIKVPLRNFLKAMPEDVYTVVLFGSVSRKEEQEDSDIDLLIISNKRPDLSKNKKEAQLTAKYPLSLFNATITQFKENKDDIVMQARKTGFPIYKEQNFYEAIVDGH